MENSSEEQSFSTINNRLFMLDINFWCSSCASYDPDVPNKLNGNLRSRKRLSLPNCVYFGFSAVRRVNRRDVYGDKTGNISTIFISYDNVVRETIFQHFLSGFCFMIKFCGLLE